MSMEPTYGKRTEEEMAIILSIHDTPQGEPEKAKKIAKMALDIATPEVVKFWLEIMRDPEQDINARLRASDLLGARQIPKVAAQHVSLDEDGVIDSVDIQGLRESILEQFNKREGNGR